VSSPNGYDQRFARDGTTVECACANLMGTQAAPGVAPAIRSGGEVVRTASERRRGVRAAGRNSTANTRRKERPMIQIDQYGPPFVRRVAIAMRLYRIDYESPVVDVRRRGSDRGVQSAGRYF
jgi:hypothetical protein